jgi:hypothetical protein
MIRVVPTGKSSNRPILKTLETSGNNAGLGTFNNPTVVRTQAVTQAQRAENPKKSLRLIF